MTQSTLALNDAPQLLPSTCTLYHGDCLLVMPALEPRSVAMVFADLPYGTFKKRSHWDQPLDLVYLWKLLSQIGQNNASFCFTATQPFATFLISSNMPMFKYDMVWNKRRGANIGNLKTMPLRVHESVLVFAEKIVTYNSQKWQGTPTQRVQKIEYRNSSHIGITRSANVISGCPHGIRHPISIINAPLGRPQHSLHPTQKPVALLEWLIATYTNEGDTVLDPVFGSNTTGVACARLGRNYIGIEKDPDYFRIGTQRVNAERTKLGLQPCEVR